MHLQNLKLCTDISKALHRHVLRLARQVGGADGTITPPKKRRLKFSHVTQSKPHRGSGRAKIKLGSWDSKPDGFLKNDCPLEHNFSTTTRIYL